MRDGALPCRAQGSSCAGTRPRRRGRPPRRSRCGSRSSARNRWVLDKVLHVYGDRTREAPDPRPFGLMPLAYERAYGGPTSTRTRWASAPGPRFRTSSIRPIPRGPRGSGRSRGTGLRGEPSSRGIRRPISRLRSSGAASTSAISSPHPRTSGRVPPRRRVDPPGGAAPSLPADPVLPAFGPRARAAPPARAWRRRPRAADQARRRHADHRCGPPALLADLSRERRAAAGRRAGADAGGRGRRDGRAPLLWPPGGGGPPRCPAPEGAPAAGETALRRGTGAPSRSRSRRCSRRLPCPSRSPRGALERHHAARSPRCSRRLPCPGRSPGGALERRHAAGRPAARAPPLRLPAGARAAAGPGASPGVGAVSRCPSPMPGPRPLRPSRRLACSPRSARSARSTRRPPGSTPPPPPRTQVPPLGALDEAPPVVDPPPPAHAAAARRARRGRRRGAAAPSGRRFARAGAAARAGGSRPSGAAVLARLRSGQPLYDLELAGADLEGIDWSGPRSSASTSPARGSPGATPRPRASPGRT